MRRLLVAFDFSRGSKDALLRAFRLAAEHCASVRLIHADEGETPLAGEDSVHRRLMAQGRSMAEATGCAGLQLSACVRYGNAAEAILAEAEAFDADLIILGLHGAPRFRDAIFGTTGTHVVRHAARAVLVVQGPGEDAYSRVMIALDEPLTPRPLFTTTFALAPAAEVFAVHAFSPSIGETLSGAAEVERAEALLERRIEEVVAEAAGNKDTGTLVNVHAVVETGDVLSVLMEADKAFKPSLLALGTRENATYLGSNAVDTLFWCEHDLLVVPDCARVMRAPVRADGLLA